MIFINKIMTKYIKILLILFCIISIFYILLVKKIELKMFEKLKITSICESFSEDIFLLAEENKVYLLKNKNIKEINSLHNVKKIISTKNENIILDNNNKIWLYDSKNDILKEISFEIPILDISNGEYFFAILDCKGQVWTSEKLTNDDKVELNGFTKINNINKIERISAGSFSKNEKYIAMLDTNNNITLYGSLDNICYNSQNNIYQFVIKDIKDFECGRVFVAVDKKGKSYIMGDKMLSFNIVSKESYDNGRKNSFAEPLVIDNEKINLIEKIKIRYNILWAYNNKNEVYYSNMYDELSNQPKEIKNIREKSQVFFERFGIVEISENKKIYLHKYNSLLQEIFMWISEKNPKNFDNFYYKSWDFVPMKYYFRL